MDRNVVPLQLWKLTIKPRGKTDHTTDPFNFCRRHGIIGIGWGLSSIPKTMEELENQFRRDYSSGIKAFRIFVSRMKVGDHVWVYGAGKYFVCRVDSDWRHESGGVWDEHDIRNLRKATWKEVHHVLVPGRIKRSITMRGTCQSIEAGEYLRRYSAWLFANEQPFKQVTASFDYERIEDELRSREGHLVFRDVLDADDTEDLVGLFLQERLGWRMLKSSTYRNKTRIECEFQRIQEANSEIAYMQVKSGNVSLRLSSYTDLITSDREYVYLFSTADYPYVDEHLKHNRLIPLSIEDLFAFMLESLRLMPLPVVVRLGIWTGVLR